MTCTTAGNSPAGLMGGKFASVGKLSDLPVQRGMALASSATLTQADLEIQAVAVFDAATNALGAGRVVPLSQAYTPPTGLYDEMFTPAGGVRPHCLGPARSLLRMTPGQLVGLRSDAERMLLRHGVTFNV